MSAYTARFLQIPAAAGGVVVMDSSIHPLEPEDGSREVALISPSSHPSSTSDLFSFNFLDEDYLPKSSSPQSSEDRSINAASHLSGSLPAPAGHCPGSKCAAALGAVVRLVWAGDQTPVHSGS